MEININIFLFLTANMIIIKYIMKFYFLKHNFHILRRMSQCANERTRVSFMRSALRCDCLWRIVRKSISVEFQRWKRKYCIVYPYFIILAALSLLTPRDGNHSWRLCRPSIFGCRERTWTDQWLLILSDASINHRLLGLLFTDHLFWTRVRYVDTSCENIWNSSGLANSG